MFRSFVFSPQGEEFLLGIKNVDYFYCEGKGVTKMTGDFFNEETPQPRMEFIFAYKDPNKDEAGWFAVSEPSMLDSFWLFVAMKKVNADGLLISPIIGKKRKGDFANKFLKESYINLLKTKYYKDNTILSFLDIYPRYAGPREAIFTAQCRKNLGCTHFIDDLPEILDMINPKIKKILYNPRLNYLKKNDYINMKNWSELSKIID